jgi:hypothetical protein
VTSTGPITLSEVVDALRFLGGEAQAKHIKDQVTTFRGGMPEHYAKPHSYRETIQRKIEDHCPQSTNYKRQKPAYFERTSRGVYKLIVSKESNVLDEIEKFKGTYEALDDTTKLSVIESRIGQGKFRDSLISYWKACSITGFNNYSLLVASHIKPWSKSNNHERLDKFNGLLLLPNLDKAFDLGFISFDDNGLIIVSHMLKDADVFGITNNMSIEVNKQHLPYLEFHRKNVFRRKLN